MTTDTQADPLADAVAHARASLPAEACGFLLAPDDGAAIVATLRAHNHAAAPDRFAMAPLALVAAAATASARGLRVVGVYHSHPQGEPTPSAADTEAARHAWRDARSWRYLILGMGQGAVTARTWRFHQGWISSSGTA